MFHFRKESRGRKRKTVGGIDTENQSQSTKESTIDIRTLGNVVKNHGVLFIISNKQNEHLNTLNL